MKEKFEDVKVGDIVYIHKYIACKGGWRTTHFGKSFVIGLEVTGVTKTQFACGKLRFKKSGSGFGGCDYAAKKLGEKIQWYGEEVISHCQRGEAEDYQKKVSKVDSFYHFDMEALRPICAKSIDDALKVVELIEQLKKLINGDNDQA